MVVNISIELVLIIFFIQHALLLVGFAWPYSYIKKPALQWLSQSKLIKVFDSAENFALLFYFFIFILRVFELLGIARTDTSYESILRQFWLSFSNLVFGMTAKKLYHLLRDNVDAFVEMEMKAFHRELILDFTPPPLSLMEVQLAIYKFICSPQFSGWENIPDNTKKLMFVGNHAILALEAPLLIYQIFKQKHMYIRALGDFTHFSVPLWSEIIKFLGVFDGNKDIAEKLMERENPILVYPGGGREAFKKKGDPLYSLSWKERLGFAKLAFKYDYTIIPISTVGTEDMLNIVADIPMGWL